MVARTAEAGAEQQQPVDHRVEGEVERQEHHSEGEAGRPVQQGECVVKQHHLQLEFLNVDINTMIFASQITHSKRICHQFPNFNVCLAKIDS